MAYYASLCFAMSFTYHLCGELTAAAIPFSVGMLILALGGRKKEGK